MCGENVIIIKEGVRIKISGGGVKGKDTHCLVREEKEWERMQIGMK